MAIIVLGVIAWIIWAMLTGEPSKPTPQKAKTPLPRTPLTPERIEELRRLVAAAVAWKSSVDDAILNAVKIGRWISEEQVESLEKNRPNKSLPQTLKREHAESSFTSSELSAVNFLGTNLRPLIEKENEKIFHAEKTARRDFFASIERTPLTDEQTRAVVCFDNRVHVLAAAGSGKTSVMVSRAAYAVSRGFVAPDKILLLAFNDAAAKELGERVRERFAAAGISSDGVRASTFHSFGLSMIGKATDSKPRVAPWVSGNRDVEKILQIVDSIRLVDAHFNHDWDLYRLVFAAAPLTPNDAKPDAYDRSTSRTGFATIKGDVVKSYGERMISDWLYINGVAYEYERAFPVDLSDADHSQYRPDFYYPKIDVWHEHWAIDLDGKPPKEFVGYEQSMRWKKEVHRQHSTTLVETTFHSIVNGTGLVDLGTEMEQRGIKLDWDPNRKPEELRRVPSDQEMARQIRRFMTHVKSNSLTPEDLKSRLQGSFRHLAGTRTDLFLSLYWRIHNEWERQLRSEGFVDFEDMLLAAADCLESGQYDAGYELILVDEFQDASQTRARLVRGLLRVPGRYLLAVGDDWQSINAFAGSDLAVLKNFEKWFGKGPQLSLTKTFRSTQAISDIASTFVQKNPGQFRKKVTTARPDKGQRTSVIMADDPKAGVSAVLEDVSNRVQAGTFTTRNGDMPTVFVLGRYRYNVEDMPKKIPENLDVRFLTIHKSKGLEADLVIVTRVVAGRTGFPSEVSDDPVVNLAMAEPDTFPDAEERRLLYVALTRARNEVALISRIGTPSRFVAELIDEKAVDVMNEKLKPTEESIPCPKCHQGTMVRRTGPYGPFLGCSAFPACRHKMKIATS
jgi:DNA helicase-4